MHLFTELFSFPLWLVFVFTVLLVIVSVESGYRYATSRRKLNKLEKEVPLGAMVGATLGLFAFMLAFTFGIVENGFQERKHALLDETNAIRNVYLRSGLIETSYRTQVLGILREYVAERLQWAGIEKGLDIRSSKELLHSLWEQAAAVGRTNPDAMTVSLFIESVNDVIDLQAKREMLRERSRVPETFWFVLFTIACFSFGSMGYHAGVSGTCRSPVLLAVAIAFSMVIALIADINRPGDGWVNVSQQAMIDLQYSLRDSKPQPGEK